MKLANPILATVNGVSALILDIGMDGAFIEHYGAVKKGDRFDLSFRWQGQELEFTCEVVRTNVVRTATVKGQATISQSAVSFYQPSRGSVEKLKDMMAIFVGRVLAAQKANAAAHAGEAAILPQLGQARRSRSRGYLTYLWDGNTWTIRRSQLSDQPRNGFTVAGYEDEEELETLCRAYEVADDAGRNLIRVVAELSANSVKK
ncbi:MAG TPA: hypothetical protein VGK31_07255 [Thermoanaerobaculia bacterium]|jgi:hypothetical protein